MWSGATSSNSSMGGNRAAKQNMKGQVKRGTNRIIPRVNEYYVQSM